MLRNVLSILFHCQLHQCSFLGCSKSKDIFTTDITIKSSNSLPSIRQIFFFSYLLLRLENTKEAPALHNVKLTKRQEIFFFLVVFRWSLFVYLNEYPSKRKSCSATRRWHLRTKLNYEDYVLHFDNASKVLNLELI